MGWERDPETQDQACQTESPADRMSLEDFCKFYDSLDICCLCPDFLDGGSSCHWSSSFYEGRWVAGTTAGGCMNFSGTSRIPGWGSVRREGLWSHEPRGSEGEQTSSSPGPLGFIIVSGHRGGGLTASPLLVSQTVSGPIHSIE